MKPKNDEPVQAWVTDEQLPDGRRFLFIRLVPRGPDARPANGHPVDFADIDVDGDGNVIGVTVPLWGPIEETSVT